MTFEDIFKKSFLEGYSTIEINTATILVALFFSLILGLYIFFCYRVMTRRTFYSRNFNISLVALTLITSAIILTIQSSVVVSLGMVGALSIVRFRTAIKDPMDLVFLFWAISVGIICGAGLSEIAILSSLAVTLVLYVLNLVPVGKAPMILVVSAVYSKETASSCLCSCFNGNGATYAFTFAADQLLQRVYPGESQLGVCGRICRSFSQRNFDREKT